MTEIKKRNDLWQTMAHLQDQPARLSWPDARHKPAVLVGGSAAEELLATTVSHMTEVCMCCVTGEEHKAKISIEMSCSLQQ